MREKFIRPFKRVDENNWFGGVCGGLAYFLGIPTWLVRFIFFFSLFFGGITIIWLYVALYVFVPKWDFDPDDYEDITSS
jgi:phage shock protein PspC (stress-responsive transcriptional regulator)